MTDGTGTTTYTYDARNRLTEVTHGSDTFSYTYDADGNVTERTYPDGTVVTDDLRQGREAGQRERRAR